MAKLTPEQIVEDAKYALENNWGYIWGKAGHVWTEREQKAVEADPNGREQTKKYGAKWIGHRVADCSGLVSWIFSKHGGYIPHGSNSQYTKYCVSKGKLTDDIQLKPGCLVFKYSTEYSNPYYHVGIYIGDNQVIEARGTNKGVIKGTRFGWTHYGYPKGVEWEGIPEDSGSDSDSGSEETKKVWEVGQMAIVDVPNDGTLNVRKTASTGSEKLGTLREGTKVEIAEVVNSEWCKVRYTCEGYVMSKFLREDE